MIIKQIPAEIEAEAKAVVAKVEDEAAKVTAQAKADWALVCAIAVNRIGQIGLVLTGALLVLIGIALGNAP